MFFGCRATDKAVTCIMVCSMQYAAEQQIQFQMKSVIRYALCTIYKVYSNMHNVQNNNH